MSSTATVTRIRDSGKARSNVEAGGVDSASSQPQISRLRQQNSMNSLSSNPAASTPVNNTTASNDAAPTEATERPFQPTRRFWGVMLSISAIMLCGAVEGTIVINALPTITAALGGGSLYIWVPNAFFLASMTVLPISAQAANVFGRRPMMLGAVFLFVLGCALCGASTSMPMLIAARAVQGIGSGAIDTLTETVVMDLVPLRQRGTYMAFTSIGALFGFTAGPFLGGVIVEKMGWQWIFYLNTILGGFAFAMFFFFLRVKHQRDQKFSTSLKRIDLGGNAIFIGAVVAVLLALTWSGGTYTWSSVQVLVPLIIGLLGLLAFTAFEWTPRLAPEPSFPRVLVSNRTSAAALAMTTIYWITTTGTCYYLPVYFQGVLAKSPLESGVAFAPLVAMIIPCSFVGGMLLSKIGKYRPFHFFGWAMLLLSVGLCTTLNRNSSPAAWASFEILSALGIGAISVSTLPAMQAPLSEKEAATSAAMHNFARTFGSIWGVTIPSAIFKIAIEQKLGQSGLADETLAARLVDGQAYELATKAFLDTLTNDVRGIVLGLFENGIHAVFYFILGLAFLGMLLVFVEKEIPMRTGNDTEFGLDERVRSEDINIESTGDPTDIGSGATSDQAFDRADDIPLRRTRMPAQSESR